MGTPPKQSIPRDGNNVPLWNPDWGVSVKCAPTVFAGGTANARGDDAGTNDPFTLFTVTGDIVVRIFGVCTVDLVGATATLSVGVLGNTAALIALTTATDIDAGDLWHDATPDSAIELDTVAPQRVIVNGADIIESVATADITAGNIYYIASWLPLSPDGSLVSAV